MDQADQLFPAHAGMNRIIERVGRDGQSVPRTRGDEPCENRLGVR